jgi:DMSO reductase anchor subunit
LIRLIPEKKKEQQYFSSRSLSAFTFLTTVSVAVTFISIKRRFRNIRLLVALIVTAGFASLFHLGQKIRAGGQFQTPDLHR